MSRTLRLLALLIAGASAQQLTVVGDGKASVSRRRTQFTSDCASLDLGETKSRSWPDGVHDHDTSGAIDTVANLGSLYARAPRPGFFASASSCAPRSHTALAFIALLGNHRALLTSSCPPRASRSRSLARSPHAARSSGWRS